MFVTTKNKCNRWFVLVVMLLQVHVLLCERTNVVKMALKAGRNGSNIDYRGQQPEIDFGKGNFVVLIFCYLISTQFLFSLRFTQLLQE